MPDSVDRIVAEWRRERPDLAVAPIEVLTRLGRVRTRIDEELAAVFAGYDLSPADFTVIAALRRAGEPYTLPQSALMARLGLTSGTVSVRLGRLDPPFGVVELRAHDQQHPGRPDEEPDPLRTLTRSPSSGPTSTATMRGCTASINAVVPVATPAASAS